MISLEYIRNKISKKIKTINEKRKFMTNCKIMNIPFNSELTYEDEKELEYLRQVESELEAWEAVKKHLEYFSSDFYNGIPEELITMTSKIDKEDYLVIKKALEVSND